MSIQTSTPTPTQEYVPSPTFYRFHHDDSPVRAVMGPVGTGKSTGCTMEVFQRACKQAPFEGKRRSRWAVIRGSYPRLKTTTIKTWMGWLGPYGRVVYGSPIVYKSNIMLPDQTELDMEVVFMPIETEADTDKLLSLELTGAWINEAAEIDHNFLTKLRARLGRYPDNRFGGHSWSGLMLDYNPPSTEHWLYKLFEEDSPPGHTLYKMPPALLLTPRGFVPNPVAENVKHLIKGYDYWLDIVGGMTEDEARSYILGEYSNVQTGKPVFPRYDDKIHYTNETLVPSRLAPIIIGMDFGLSPAAVLGQMTPVGQLMLFDEITGSDMYFEQFLHEHLLPLLRTRYDGFQFEGQGDPVGASRNALSMRTVFDMLRDAGIPSYPAVTNSIPYRLDAVNKLLNRVNGVVVGPGCPMVRKGFLGEYRYMRKRGSQIFKTEPEKNACSHAMDAVQYIAMRIVKGTLPHSARQPHDGFGQPPYPSIVRKPFLWV